MSLFPDINKYSDILEYVPENNINIDFTNDKLFTNLCSFLNEYKINKILLSLSGGVDSMVLNEILCKISKLYNISFICCHINYNNRPESILERQFLEGFCKHKSIDLHYIDLDFKRDDMKRNLYEKETRDIRYNYYKKLCKEYNCDGVFLGHHKDDLSENIFNNVMRGGRELTDLSVLKETNNILGATVYRPFLDFYKSSIIEFAHKNNVPYFLDTTPDWSCRGIMRNKIFPVCNDCYGDIFTNNLLKLGEESDNVNYILSEYILLPLYNKVIFDNKNFTIKKENIIKEKYILKLLLKKISYELNISAMKQKNIELLILHFNDNKKLTLMKNYVTIINDIEIKFIHI
tara:strand:+ start:1904 stop:2944 length:1041 start_codon:yes stop_codon:yes gene_type:complete